MEQIKFRVWDIAEDNWIEKMNIFHGDFTGYFGITGTASKGIKIMQFTGLKDKNGKEIYEGDIVSLLPLRIGDPIVYAEIKFEDGSFDMFGINRPVNTKQIRFVRELYVECITNHVEVIGNRFENSELLEVKE